MRVGAALLVGTFLLLAVPRLPADGETVTVDVPRGNGVPVLTDGYFSPGEWDDSLRIALNDSIALHFKEHGGVLFAGIRGREPFVVGPSELCIARPGGPIVKLHVSAQLYEVELPAEGKEPAPRFGLTRLWYASEVRRDEPLSKQLMSEGKSPIEMIRASHYPTDGLEFAVRREKFPGDRWLVRLQASAFLDGKPGRITWPAGTEERKTDGWAELRLAAGGSAVAPDWEREASGTTSALIGTGPWGAAMLAVGQQGAILRRSGGAWSQLTPPARIQFSIVWAASANELFVAGDEGALFHFDGTQWKRFESGTTANLDSIWGSSSRDVFAVGDADGAIVHFDGDRWRRMESGTAQPLFSVCGTSPHDVFAVGMGGTILHFDGIAWRPMLSGTAATLTGIFCFSPSNVYAVGSGGTILHFDGQTWSAMASGSNGHLTRVWGRSQADVFVIGMGGVTLRNRGDGWRPLVSGTGENLYGISGNAETVVAVGRAGTILRLR